MYLFEKLLCICQPLTTYDYKYENLNISYFDTKKEEPTLVVTLGKRLTKPFHVVKGVYNFLGNLLYKIALAILPVSNAT